MSDNYPEGSMRGSGIYASEVSYSAFTCENEECGKENGDGETVTDDWGNYTVECEFCGSTYLESSVSQDRDDYYADRDDDDDRYYDD
jgi:hypothetical protein